MNDALYPMNKRSISSEFVEDTLERHDIRTKRPDTSLGKL